MGNLLDSKDQDLTINKLVDCHSDKLYSWALFKTNCKETAEDLVQETFLSAVQSTAIKWQHVKQTLPGNTMPQNGVEITSNPPQILKLTIWPQN